MQKELIPLKSATELDLLIKVSKIVDDAVLEKTGSSASELLVLELLEDDEEKKTVTAAATNPAGLTAETLEFITKEVAKRLGPNTANRLTRSIGFLNLVKKIGPYALIGILGHRGYHKIKELLGLDPYKRGNLPAPYEHIEEPYKFDEVSDPTKSRTVSPGFYEPEQTGEDWYKQLEQGKYLENLSQTGVPAGFGTAPGLVIDSKNNDEFSSILDQLRRGNFPQNVASNNDKRQITAQGAGSFTTETIQPIEGLSPSKFSSFISPTSWEQFLSQGAGQWAAAPSPDVAFYDPSGTLGRTKPIEIKPPGYGKDFATIDPLAYRKEMLKQFNLLEPQREAAKSVFYFNQINLLEGRGVISPEEANKLRFAIKQLTESKDPNLASQIEFLINNAVKGEAYRLPGQTGVAQTIPGEGIDWETRKDPLENEFHKRMLERATGAMEEYKGTPLYQDIAQRSPLLSKEENI